jgi:tetratricopeptide (TPR) repeat protein
MAFIEGQNLRKKIESDPLELEEALRIATQVAEGLQEAHKKGVIHRDIKSANIMVTEKNQANIMDFGLARVTEGTLVTQEGVTMGTVAYMSPEQARGEKVDHRSDIWSWGVVLYEMLTGKLPFRGEHEHAMVYSILKENPKPINDFRSEIPVSIEQVVDKALEKDPDKRYQNTEELLDDLKSISAGIVPEEIKARLRKAKLLRRKRAILYSGVAGFLVLMTVIAISLFTGRAEAMDSIAVLPLENLWAQSYEREMWDILVLQSEIAQAIAEEIKVKLTPEEQVRLASARPVNPEAHEAYLKGLYHWNRSTLRDRLKATQYFEEAIRKDRTYAPAYAGLADTYAWSFGGSSLPPRELYPKAREAALKALELDDRLAEAHASLAFIKDTYDWDWAGAEKEYKRAIELNPSYASAHAWYAFTLAIKGRFEEAFAEMKRAEELDPLSLPIKTQIGWLYFYQSQFDRAIEQWRKTLELDPNFSLAHYNLGLGYVQKGMYEEAIGAFRKAIALGEEQTGYLAQLAYAYAMSGQKGEALRILAKLNERSKREYVPSSSMALLHLGLGNKEQAFELLEKAYQERDPNLTSYLKLEPFWLKPLWSDPRFQDLLRRMNFPE